MIATALKGLRAYFPLYEPAAANRLSLVGGYSLAPSAANPAQTSGPIQLGIAFVRASIHYLGPLNSADFRPGDTNWFMWLWGRLTSQPAAVGQFAGVDSNGAGTRGWKMAWENATSRIRFTIFKAADAAAGVDWSAAPANGVWYFLSGWHDADNDQVGIWVDGGPGVVAATGGAAQTSTGVLVIGSRDNVSGDDLDGDVAEFGFVRDRIPMAGELDWLWNKGKGRRFPFDQFDPRRRYWRGFRRATGHVVGAMV
jgi:hypothetical protein